MLAMQSLSCMIKYGMFWDNLRNNKILQVGQINLSILPQDGNLVICQVYINNKDNNVDSYQSLHLPIYIQHDWEILWGSQLGDFKGVV